MGSIRFVSVLALFVVMLDVGLAAQDPVQMWGDFFHYIRIARFDLAKAYGQAILQGPADPVTLFELSNKAPQDYQLLVRASDNIYDEQLAQLARKVIDLIEQGRQARRSDAAVIMQEIDRLLTGTDRAVALALRRLQDSGEYAVPLLLDAIGDPTRRGSLDRLLQALTMMGGPAIRPLCVAIQASNPAVRVEVVRSMGRIGSFEVVPYLKYTAENDPVDEIRNVAGAGIRNVDPSSQGQSAARLFYRLALQYYQQSALVAGQDAHMNMWFWDRQGQRLVRRPVDGRYFYELMAMRACEWAVRSDPGYGDAFSLWAAAFLKAGSKGLPLPDFLTYGRAGPVTYATALGPRFLIDALSRALTDRDSAVALGALEGLVNTAGPGSVLMAVGANQPVLEALRSEDPAVRTTAALAIAHAGPKGLDIGFAIEALGAAVSSSIDPNLAGDSTEKDYAVRALQALLMICERQDPSNDLSTIQQSLFEAVSKGDDIIRSLACKVLAYIPTEQAQTALALEGLDGKNSIDLRVTALESLGLSARLHGQLLKGNLIEQLLDVIVCLDQHEDLRTAASLAVGSLGLDSPRLKDIILAGAMD